MTSIQIGSPLPLAYKVACWNVRTLLDNKLSDWPHRKTALLARELSLYDIDIAGLLGHALLMLVNSQKLFPVILDFGRGNLRIN